MKWKIDLNDWSDVYDFFFMIYVWLYKIKMNFCLLLAELETWKPGISLQISLRYDFNISLCIQRNNCT